MNNFDLRKYLAEGRLFKENVEQGYTLYTTNVEYDNGKTGYMYQLTDTETEEENEIGFDQLYFDDEDNRLEMGVDFKDFDQGSYQEGEYTADEAMKLYNDLAEGRLLKEELTWYVEDENEDIRFQNDEYLKEVGKKIKEIHPDISSEDLNKIIIMTGEQYSREEDFHGDSIPSGNFVDAAVEIYQTDVLGSDGEDDKDFDEWAPENLDGDFPKDSTFAGWTQAQYDAYQEEPRKYEKYLGGGSFELS